MKAKFKVGQVVNIVFETHDRFEIIECHQFQLANEPAYLIQYIGEGPQYVKLESALTPVTKFIKGDTVAVDYDNVAADEGIIKEVLNGDIMTAYVVQLSKTNKHILCTKEQLYLLKSGEVN